MMAAASVAEEATEEPGEGGQHPLVGHVVGERYRIDALLGEGGMGAVFRATHLGLGRSVAMKVLHPRLSQDPHIAKRFDREALAVSKLDHPNCVQVLDFGTTPKGMKYLVMQLLEGRELRDLTGVALPIEQVVYLGLQVLRALEHAHKRGLVHRDLKPENIFVVEDDDGNQIAKLVDFGIVKLLDDAPAEKLTRMGMAFGTPTYMSPEQATGGTIDARTDLYAVGVVLYELLTGVPPFTADEPGILLRMHLLADLPPLPDTVPAKVAAVVTKLLAKEPGDRYADASEARRALARAYPLPSKITGAGGFSAVVRDEPSDPPVLPPLAAPGADAPQGHAPTNAPAPTAAQADAPTRAEPAPEDSALFVRSGGTVLAPPTVPPGMAGPVPAASSSHGGMPIVAPMPSSAASSSHGASMSMPMPGAAASMSHGSVPIVPPSSPRYDPLAMSSQGLPVMGPGLHTSGAHPYSAAHAALTATAARREAKRRTNTLLVVGGVLLTWVVIGIVWWASRDAAGPSPSSAPPAPAKAPAKAPAAGGLYRFVGEGSAESPGAAGKAGADETPKKPKRDDDDD